MIVLFFFACAGTKTATKNPESLVSGMQEITKGTNWYQKGCRRRAMESFFRAFEAFTLGDHQNGIAMSLNNIGNIYRDDGDIATSILFFNDAARIYAEIQDDPGAIQALANKAAALIEADRLEEDADSLEGASKIAGRRNIRSISLMTRNAILLKRKGELRKAEALLYQAVGHADPINYSDTALANAALGQLLLETGKTDKAIERMKTALEADRLSGYVAGVADDLSILADLYLRNDDVALAVSHFKRSMKVHALLGNKEKVEELTDQLEKACEKTACHLDPFHQLIPYYMEKAALGKRCD